MRAPCSRTGIPKSWTEPKSSLTSRKFDPPKRPPLHETRPYFNRTCVRCGVVGGVAGRTVVAGTRETLRPTGGAGRRSCISPYGPCVDSGIRVTPSFRFERILPKKHNPIKSPKTRLFRLQRSARGAQRRWGVKEMSTDTTGSHPTFICPDRG